MEGDQSGSGIEDAVRRRGCQSSQAHEALAHRQQMPQ